MQRAKTGQLLAEALRKLQDRGMVNSTAFTVVSVPAGVGARGKTANKTLVQLRDRAEAKPVGSWWLVHRPIFGSTP